MKPTAQKKRFLSKYECPFQMTCPDRPRAPTETHNVGDVAFTPANTTALCCPAVKKQSGLPSLIIGQIHSARLQLPQTVSPLADPGRVDRRPLERSPIPDAVRASQLMGRAQNRNPRGVWQNLTLAPEDDSEGPRTSWRKEGRRGRNSRRTGVRSGS